MDHTRVVDNASRVDDTVDRAEPLARVCNHLLHLQAVCNVGTGYQYLASMRLNRLKFA